ncbi:MAG: type II toxin-antitoxin system RelE/ParE family toxin [Armatimonadota bacterium]
MIERLVPVLRPLYYGKEFEIWAIVRPDGSSYVKNFLTNLDDEREAAKMRKLIRYFGDQGSIYNIKSSRSIQGENELFELKAGRLRIMFFYDPLQRRRVILTHGFLKNTGPPIENDIQRAKRLRQSYIDAMGD